MKYYSLILLAFICISCNQDPEENSEINLNGFWQNGFNTLLIRDSIMTHPYYDLPGFFNYNLVEDSLIVFDTGINNLNYNFTCLFSVSSDNQFDIIYENDTLSYKKVKNTAPTNFTKITFEAGECFGTCPVFKMTIDSNGKLVYTGINNTNIKGLNEFSLDTETIESIKCLLSIVDIKNYPDDKYSPLPDDPTFNLKVEYEDSEPTVINGGLFKGKYYFLIKYFYRFDTVIEKTVPN